MMWHDGWGAGSWLAMSFMMLLFWALVISVIIWVARGHTRIAQPAQSQARQILDERYARGEINDDEYKQRRDQLAVR
jgi:putative membrane protein